MEKKIMEALRALEIPVYSIVKEQRSTAELFLSAGSWICAG